MLRPTMFSVHCLQHALTEANDGIDEDSAINVDEVRMREPVCLAVLRGKYRPDTR
jgi:hypothetical protein